MVTTIIFYAQNPQQQQPDVPGRAGAFHASVLFPERLVVAGEVFS